MNDCEADRPAPLRCPTIDEVLGVALALLPRGRAWQSNEGGPQRDSVLRQFWRSVADFFTFVNHRLCDLRLEFWCATQAETRDLWMAEYGLPNDCDPFPDLCTKVAAIGGTRCEYYSEIAARAGWSIACISRAEQCGIDLGVSQAGCMQPGAGLLTAQLIIQVFLSESPSYGGGAQTAPQPGAIQSGMPLGCGPDIRPLQCILDRVVHAEIQIIYEVIE